jgi:hypothetical protein
MVSGDGQSRAKRVLTFPTSFCDNPARPGMTVTQRVTERRSMSPALSGGECENGIEAGGRWRWQAAVHATDHEAGDEHENDPASGGVDRQVRQEEMEGVEMPDPLPSPRSPGSPEESSGQGSGSEERESRRCARLSWTLQWKRNPGSDREDHPEPDQEHLPVTYLQRKAGRAGGSPGRSVLREGRGRGQHGPG